MCRWIAYSGGPVYLEEVLFRPKHSLIDQSLSARSGATTTNGDGFGVGWYGTGATPGLYKAVQPAWSDENLHDLASQIKTPMFMAHVRATTGTAVQRTNCHPFRHQNWLFQHNGAIREFSRVKRDLLLAIAPGLFSEISGSTDSEIMFYLALTFGLQDDPVAGVEKMIGFVEEVGHSHGVTHPIQMTLAILDGRTLYAFRYSSEGNSRTLFHSADVATLRNRFPNVRQFSDDTRAVVSEPVGAIEAAGEVWVEIPESSAVVVNGGKVDVRRLQPRTPLTGAPAVQKQGSEQSMKKLNKTMRCGLAFLAAAWLGAGPVAAQSAGETLAGKTVTLIIGFGSGGGYDLWGRLVARHIGKHLPGNPTVVPQNMPGAGSYVAASHIYGAAPKDGTTFAIIARDAALGPLSGAPGARFDATKMSWLGSPTREHNACIANATAKVKTANDLRDNELILGDTGPGTGTRSYPKVLNDLLGYKFKLVSGFRSSADVFLAMERGEVDGICESLDSINQRKPDWIPKKVVNVLLQAGAESPPMLAGVPNVLTLARNAEEKQVLEYLYAGQDIGRPFVAPPGLPADKLKMLRDAFDATMRDPEFVADVKRNKFELEPEDGQHLAALIDKIYATPKPIIERVSNLIK